MSSIYHTEPPTQGKVMVKTNYGDIDIELWAKEAPLACRNFIQLALEGYYDNTNVNRVVKGFMVQMGDPTGTGSGGSSIWGRPFKDEIHGRIKFNHRGQLAMANANKPNSNQSQFFITLDNCDWLNGKHTIFGKVTGSTIFNVIRMSEAEVNEEDKPLEHIIIKKIEILWNPFDDIAPRATIKKETETKPSDKTQSKSKLKSVKNTKLLSFMQDSDEEQDGGSEEEEEEGEKEVVVKMKSIHDLKRKKKPSSKPQQHEKNSDNEKDDNKEDEEEKPPSKRSKLQPNETNRDKEEMREAKDDGKAFDVHMKQQLLKKKHAYDLAKASKQSQSHSTKDNEDIEEDIMDKSSMQALVENTLKQEQVTQSTKEFYALRQQLLSTKRAIHVLTGQEKIKQDQTQAYEELISPLEQRRLKYQQRKHDFGNRANETLTKLQSFTSKLRQSKAAISLAKEEEGTESSQQQQESYHGQILEEEDEDDTRKQQKKQQGVKGLAGEEESTLQQDWFVGKLKCKKHIDHEYRLAATSSSSTTTNGAPGALGIPGIHHGYGADGRAMDDYILIDPRKKK